MQYESIVDCYFADKIREDDGIVYFFYVKGETRHLLVEHKVVFGCKPPWDRNEIRAIYDTGFDPHELGWAIYNAAHDEKEYHVRSGETVWFIPRLTNTAN